MVAPGAKFRLRLVVLGRDAALTEKHARALIKVLKSIEAADGVSLGKGEADGQGYMRLAGRFDIEKYELGGDGDFHKADDISQLWRDTGVSQRSNVDTPWTLNFRCPGPFAILDSSWGPPKDSERDNCPQLKAQRIREKLPLILGSSITGAMRARARWLAALEAHQRNLPAAIDNDERLVKTEADIKNLTSIERLFGVTGFRALLTIGRIYVNEATPFSITSVKLDRFSGAPIDNALFRSDIFVDTRFTLHLELRHRPGKHGMPTTIDRDFAEGLIKDICDHGLELGHGTNKGFGWFEARRV